MKEFSGGGFEVMPFLNITEIDRNCLFCKKKAEYKVIKRDFFGENYDLAMCEAHKIEWAKKHLVVK